MAKRHSMRDGPLAQLFKQTETVSEIAAKADAAADSGARPQMVEPSEDRLDAVSAQRRVTVSRGDPGRRRRWRWV